MKKIILLNAFALLLLVLSSMPAPGQAQVTREDYERAEQFLPWNAAKKVFKLSVSPNWIEKTDRFWYLNKTRNGKEFVLVDPEHASQQPAFDQVKLAASLSAASQSAYDPGSLPFDTFEYSKDGKSISFDVEKRHWTCTLDSYSCTSVERPAPPSPAEVKSPDGKWAAFTKDYNLYVKELATGKEIQLTKDGERYYDYAGVPESSTSFVSDEIAGKPHPADVVWSPDSTKLVTLKMDQRKVKDLYLIQSVTKQGYGRPALYTYRYPMVGDKELPMAEWIVFDVAKGTSTKLSTDQEDVELATPINFKRVWWSDDSKGIYIIHHERGFKSVSLRLADPENGTVRTILEEKGPNYVDPYIVVDTPKAQAAAKGAEMVWLSEHDGWAHLYRYDTSNGSLRNQITRGPWVVRGLLHVDDAGGWVYFMGSGKEDGRDPYYQQLYRVKPDGSGLQLLTPEDAEHDVKFSPSYRYFIDTYSRADMPPVSVLRSADGTQIKELEHADIDLLLATGWKYPERFVAKARDGVTNIYGLIWRPTNFDPSKKYPVLDSIYPGPQINRTPKSFQSSYSDPFGQSQAFAELGFIVVTIDGFGIPFRSKAFHDFSYNNLQDGGGLEDHIAAFHQLAAKYPSFDLSRVGIYGHSGGGFASTRAILKYPDFYKVAVSSAGNHDQRDYIAMWGERYQGLLDGNNYDKQANTSLAGNLKGKLMLAYGDMDDNVHPSMTIQMVDALIKANKDFDLLLLPNRNHGTSAVDPYFLRRRWDYFVKNLLGAEPPAGYAIKPSGVE